MWPADAVHAFRGLQRAAQDGGDTSELGRGPWVRVALNSEAHATVDHAYNNASIRIGDLAAVNVVLRPGDAGARTAVVLDGIEVGQLDAGAGPPEEETVGAQIGRLAGRGLYVMQLRLP